MKTILITKPQQIRSKLKFSAILDSCPRVLASEGFDKASAAKMATEAEISIASFYDYFSCKEAVYLAYLDRELNRALSTVSSKVNAAPMEPNLILRDLIAVGIDFAYQHRPIIKTIFEHFPEHAALINLKDSHHQLSDIAMKFSKQIDHSLITKDPSLVLFTLSNLILGFQFRIIAMPDERFNRDQIITELHHIMVNYLFPRA